MEEPGGLQSMGSLRVGHDWVTSLSLFTFMHWRRKWQPTPVFLPGESQGRGAWWAAVYGVTQSQIRLKRLSSSSSTLRSTAVNKANGCNEIPVELFKTLKDDAMKVLHSICQQIWKTHQWPQYWKRSVLIPIPNKGSAKEYTNHQTIILISRASKIMLKILHARLQHYAKHGLPDDQARFRKDRGTRDQIANICWIIEKARELKKKKSTSVLSAAPKPLIM